MCTFSPEDQELVLARLWPLGAGARKGPEAPAAGEEEAAHDLMAVVDGELIAGGDGPAGGADEDGKGRLERGGRRNALDLGVRVENVGEGAVGQARVVEAVEVMGLVARPGRERRDDHHVAGGARGPLEAEEAKLCGVIIEKVCGFCAVDVHVAHVEGHVHVPLGDVGVDDDALGLLSWQGLEAGLKLGGVGGAEAEEGLERGGAVGGLDREENLLLLALSEVGVEVNGWVDHSTGQAQGIYMRGRLFPT